VVDDCVITWCTVFDDCVVYMVYMRGVGCVIYIER
jgi:hypothetical protein